MLKYVSCFYTKEEAMLKKKRKWSLIVGFAAIFLVVGITADLFFMSQYTKGIIEMPDDFPSSGMMAHIAAHLDELCAAESFTHTEIPGDFTILEYTNQSGLSIIIQYEYAATPEDVISAAANWTGQYLATTDWLAALSGTGKYLLSFVGTQGPLLLVITQENATAITVTPLAQAIAHIEGIIGTP